MFGDKICIGLSVLASLGTGLAQDVITEDSYFYGQSPPVYPSPPTTGTGNWAAAYAKAQTLVAQLTLDEKVNLTAGYSTNTGCSGGIPPIPRLGFTGLCLNDAAAGVRGTDFVSAWPSGLHVGASWNKELALQRATAMGKEAKKKGVNTLLAPVVGPAFRVALGGRNWEGFAADPYLAGALVSETVTGLQDTNVMACVKHFVGNEQETYRLADGNISSVSSNIDDATLHEFYVWPFQDAVHAGAASVMCSYNRVNNSHGCQNSKILNGVLKEELGFQGFVVSDWGALLTGYEAADAGLDVVMPNGVAHWGGNLTLSVTNGSLSEARVTDMATRVLSAWYLLDQEAEIPVPGVGLPADITVPHTIVDARDAADRPVLRQSAVEGHVLVKNKGGALPLKSPRLLYVAGYSAREADQTSPSAAGSGFSLGYESSVEMVRDYATSFSGVPGDRRGPAIAANGTIIAGGGSGATAQAAIVSPFHALVQRAAADGTYLYWDFTSAEPVADSAADACLVFGNVWATESVDRPNLRDNYTDTLIESVAATCANTVVVLHNAGVRLVDRWIDHANITAVVFAHLPGQLSGEALVSLLYGDDNFSGKLPYTVPKNESDYGTDLLEPALPSGQYALFPQSDFSEGVFVDYRHFDRAAIEPRYPFGFGLSYTTFNYSGLAVQTASVSTAAYPTGAVQEGGPTDLWDVVATVSAAVSNTGAVAGQEVAQLYVTIPGDGPVRQLRGFEKVQVAAGQTATVSFALTRRDLSVWDTTAQQWKLQAGRYAVFVGASSRDLPLEGALEITGRNCTARRAVRLRV